MEQHFSIRENILSYIKNSPLLYEHPSVNITEMSTEELLDLANGVVERETIEQPRHLYEIIPIDSFATAKNYEHYAPNWCIFESEEVFYEETHQGSCHFIFCRREDADTFGQLTFGKNYPYDNYGMSFIAVLLTKGNRVVSVTSRRNWDENYDHYLNDIQLEEALGRDLYHSAINRNPLRILHLFDTHNRHHELCGLPDADIIIHSGNFTQRGTEDEVLDFLNWFIELPFPHKIFVAGNHDQCLLDADNIEDLPDDVHFLQDRMCEIEGIRFFGLGYNHPKWRVPSQIDVLITHESPAMMLDEPSGTHCRNSSLRNIVFKTKPRLHLIQEQGKNKYEQYIYE